MLRREDHRSRSFDTRPTPVAWQTMRQLRRTERRRRHLSAVPGDVRSIAGAREGCRAKTRFRETSDCRGGTRSGRLQRGRRRGGRRQGRSVVAVDEHGEAAIRLFPGGSGASGPGAGHCVAAASRYAAGRTCTCTACARRTACTGCGAGARSRRRGQRRDGRTSAWRRSGADDPVRITGRACATACARRTGAAGRRRANAETRHSAGTASAAADSDQQTSAGECSGDQPRPAARARSARGSGAGRGGWCVLSDAP